MNSISNRKARPLIPILGILLFPVIAVAQSHALGLLWSGWSETLG
jgi:hypothetical protein